MKAVWGQLEGRNLKHRAVILGKEEQRELTVQENIEMEILYERTLIFLARLEAEDVGKLLFLPYC